MSNTTTLAGNLTRDPEIRYTRDGQANATFGLAVNRRWQPRGSEEWEEATSSSTWCAGANWPRTSPSAW